MAVTMEVDLEELLGFDSSPIARFLFQGEILAQAPAVRHDGNWVGRWPVDRRCSVDEALLVLPKDEIRFPFEKAVHLREGDTLEVLFPS